MANNNVSLKVFEQILKKFWLLVYFWTLWNKRESKNGLKVPKKAKNKRVFSWKSEKMDYGHYKSSQGVQNIVVETLEGVWKISKNFFFSQIFGDFGALWSRWGTKNGLKVSQKS